MNGGPNSMGSVARFASALIAAGEATDAIAWPAFTSKAKVEAQLSVRGYALIQDRATHDPSKKRFFATRKAAR